MVNVTPHNLDKTVKTLEEISSIVEKSFGPFGGYTLVENMKEVTKDGDSILKSIGFNSDWETEIKRIVVQGSSYIGDREPGDGTTSFVLILSELFKRIVPIYNRNRKTLTSIQFSNLIKDISIAVKQELENHTCDITASSLRDLFRVSLNNDVKRAKALEEVLKIVTSGENYDVDKLLSKEELSLLSDVILKIDDGSKLDYKVSEQNGFSMRALPKFSNVKELSRLGILEDTIILPLIDGIDTEVALNKLVEIIKNVAAIASSTGIKNIFIHGFAVADPVLNIIDKLREIYCDSKNSPIENIIYMSVPMNDPRRMEDHEDLLSFLGTAGLRLETFTDTGELETKDTLADPDVFNGPYLSSLDKYIVVMKNGVTMITRSDENNIPKSVNKKITYLEERIKELGDGATPSEIGRLKRRIHRLNADKVISITVGGETDTRTSTNVSMYKDALLSMSSALKHGLVYGISTSVVNATEKINLKNVITNEDHLPIANELLSALKESYSSIGYRVLSSAGDIVDVVGEYNKMKNEKPKDLINGGTVYSTLNGEKIILDKLVDIVSTLIQTNQWIHASHYEANKYIGM